MTAPHPDPGRDLGDRAGLCAPARRAGLRVRARRPARGPARGDRRRSQGAAAPRAAETVVDRSRGDRQRSRGACATIGRASASRTRSSRLRRAGRTRRRRSRTSAQARALLDANFTSAALWVLALAARTSARRAAHRRRTSARSRATAAAPAISSTAPPRRASTASSKGLRTSMTARRCASSVVKPGFVDTPMTAGIAKGGPLWATPDQRRRRHRSARLRNGRRVRLHAVVLVGDHDDHPPPAVVRVPAAEDLIARRIKIALTGAAGLVGQNLIPRLKARGYAASSRSTSTRPTPRSCAGCIRTSP